MSPGRQAIAAALAAAILFGLSTPAAKLLLTVADPWMTAGLLYLGSGLGLGGYRLLQRLAGARAGEARFQRADLPWLIGAIVSGGGIGPVLLMLGLVSVAASQASLLLNLEGVLTAVLAWVVFREHFDRQILLGLALITGGAGFLAWEPIEGWPLQRGSLLVIGACLAWAVDNNLTRKVSGGDPMVMAALKGGVAGAANLAIAIMAGAPAPGVVAAGGVAVVGLFGYGVSLVLFIRALRGLGAARTGAYFSAAPFIGAFVSIVTLDEPLRVGLLAGGALMIAGLWLHVTERHEHEHVHEPLAHDHRHRHDEHHQHAHDAGVAADEPHSHRHVHASLRHSHPHYPDIHHRHGH
jgi:drug/metabolite transporter (DMT)-like permease